MRIQCQLCGELVHELYRANRFGEFGIWYCESCMIAEGLDIDPQVKEVVNAISPPLPTPKKV